MNKFELGSTVAVYAKVVVVGLNQDGKINYDLLLEFSDEKQLEGLYSVPEENVHIVF